MNAPPCTRCNGDRFISGDWPNLPDEPCPACNPGAPSGAERVKAHATRPRVPMSAPVDQERKDVAEYIAQALRESPAYQNKEGWSSSAKVAESTTTSGCPLITFTLGVGQAFNITITRARK